MGRDVGVDVGLDLRGRLVRLNDVATKDDYLAGESERIEEKLPADGQYLVLVPFDPSDQVRTHSAKPLVAQGVTAPPDTRDQRIRCHEFVGFGLLGADVQQPDLDHPVDRVASAVPTRRSRRVADRPVDAPASVEKILDDLAARLRSSDDEHRAFG